MLATYSSLDQTATHIAGQKCVKAAGAGAGASNNRKGMITGAVVCQFEQSFCWSAVGQLFESKTQVETDTSLYVGLKRLRNLYH
jgi:hypothetical protein